MRPLICSILIGLATTATCAAAAEPYQSYSYNGLSLEALSQRVLEREDVAPGLSVLTGYGSTSGLKMSWITRTASHAATTVNLWEGSCAKLSSSPNKVVDRRETTEAIVWMDGPAKLTQVGSYCWVAHGSEAQQLDALSRLLGMPPAQALPHREKPQELVDALAQLNLFLKSSPRQQTAPSRWQNLTAGQVVSTPEDAATKAGFSTAKVAARASDQGVGYLLHCGSAKSAGQAGLVALGRETNRANQFSTFVTKESAASVLAQQIAQVGKPSKEVFEKGRTTYVWYSGDVATRFEQQSDSTWLFSWQTNCGNDCI